LGAIWVIEKNHTRSFDAAAILMGDFAVRKIASLKSFSYLLRIRCAQLPSILVIDARDDDFSISAANQLLQIQMATCPRIFLTLGTAFDTAADLGTGASTYAVSDDTKDLDFSIFIQNFLLNIETSRVQQPGILSYRDLRLDTNQFQLQILPSDRTEVLPLKEARLLRFFMENAGKCLSRAEIQRAVWEGIKIESRTVDSHISRLRKRIGVGEVLIESQYGDGYKMS
jgi:DNA-binding response OmpR family regulator